jgi:Tfp pilus assembly protein PilV
MRERKGGFTLLECLIALSLSFFVVFAALGFFASASRHFFGLKEKEEAAQDVLAAMDKMRIDIVRSGQGLAGPISLGAVQPFEQTAEGLVTVRAERAWPLAADSPSGAVRVALSGGLSEIKPGREVCLWDAANAEIRTVAAVEAEEVVVSEPLASGYAAGEASFALLERVRLTWDETAGVLRRKVNSSSAQPLLETARAASFLCDAQANLVRIRLSLEPQGEPYYEALIFPKNPALARPD